MARELFKIFSKFSVLQRRTHDSVGSLSRSRPEDVSLPIKKINEYVYEVSSSKGAPSVSSRRPSMEIVFFHSVQLDGHTDLHITTWLSRDESELWLLWLFEEIPDARILLVSYDASLDMYRTRENLLQSLTGLGATIGQEGCPVVLVGHSLGGLVMKELCIQANSILSLNRTDEQNPCVKRFLMNVKGLFFYAYPHHGFRLADNNKDFSHGELFEDVKTLNSQMARTNEDFRKLRKRYQWKTFGVGENCGITLGNYFRGLVVPEASARSDMDSFYTISDADHFTVCQPDARTSNSFQLLSNFVARMLKQDQNRSSTKMSFSGEYVGLEVRVQEISKALQDQKRIGVVGIAGIGKTTVARALFDTISGRFDYTCFLGDVKNSMGAGGDSKNLQNLILRQLHHNGHQVHKEFCWDTLKGKKVLIVLDDAEIKSQVMVMTGSDSFSKDSRVIVTARDSRFLIAEDFFIIWLEQLNRDDSIRLFCLHAFKRPVPPKAYEKQVTRFAEKCGGLPLAIIVTGEYLCNQSAKAWNGAFDKLRRAKPINGSRKDGLWSILRVSYDDLAYEEQEMFLDVATCFHGANLEKVQEAWRVCSWGSPVTGWQNLVDRGMVKEDDDGDIWMHETLRDLGRSIACPDDQNVTSHTRVFDVRLTRQLLNQENALVKVLRITLDELGNPGQKLAAMGFSGGLKELQILWLDGHSLDCLESMRDVLPQLVFLRMDCFPREQWLYGLRYCRSISLSLFYRTLNDHSDEILSSLWKLHQLEYLELKETWIRTLPKKFGELSALAHLEFRDSWNLTILPPEFGNLSQLEHLVFNTCENLKILPPEFGTLSQLEHLVFNRCKYLEILPAEFGKLQALRYLEISKCGLRELPNSFVQLEGLEHLVLEYCDNLNTLPAEFGKLQGLRYLEISHCKFRELPSSFVQLEALEVLKLDGCFDLLIRLSCLWPLRHLEQLEIRYCDKIFELDGWNGLLVVSPGNWNIVMRLPHLTMEELRLTTTVDCKEGGVMVRTLPSNVDGLCDDSSYEKAPTPFRSHCHSGSLATLSGGEGWGQIQTLQTLTIKGKKCSGLPGWLGQCQELKNLCFKESGVSYSKLHDVLGQLVALESLKLVGCDQLIKLPPTLCQLQSLQTLIIKSFSFSELPHALGQLGTLKRLTISLCPRLKALPDTLGKLGALEHLKIETCDGLRALPNSLGNLGALEHLTIRYCHNLKALPDTLGNLGALEHLTIDFCTNLEALPDTLGNLGALRRFRIKYSKLVLLPESVGRLRALEKMEVHYCHDLMDLPESVWKFPENVLEISYCPHLERT